MSKGKIYTSPFVIIRKYFAVTFFPSLAAYLIYSDYTHTQAWKKEKAIIEEARAAQKAA